MEIEDKVTFKLNGKKFDGQIEKEYENSYLVNVDSDDLEMHEKYHNRIIVSKREVKKI